MKICVISSTVFACPPPGYSGLEQLAWQRAEGLAKKGHEVALVAPKGSRCDHATVIETGPPGGWDEKTAYSGYWQYLPNFDVIIDETWQKWSYNLKLEGKLTAPILAVCHAPINTMFGSLPPGIEKPCFVCISQDQANHFEALFSRPARVAYNGVDPEFYKAIPGIRRTDRFLFLARFSTIKGPDLAIQACKEAGVGLDLVGDTSITNEPDFFKMCESMCDGKQIRMVGPATRGECVHWFSQAHALIHPNQRYREPFGLAPVEAMLCGCPVIAWDFGAMRETVFSSGLLVKSYDDLVEAIVKLKSGGTEPGFVSKENRTHVRSWAMRFSVDNMVDRYEQLCQEAIETGGW